MSKTNLSETLRRFEPHAFAALRIVSGLMFSFHGMQKVLGIYTDHQPAAFTQMWIGGWIELVCGLLIAFGLFTRWTSFLASGTMAVAYTQFHWGGAIDGGQWIPTVNHGELSLLYCFVFFLFFFHGSGIFSLDRLRKVA